MNNNLFQKIKSEYKNHKIIIGQNEKCLIKDILYEGISIEFMPNNFNAFTIRYREFNFFDKASLQNYFNKKLQYKDVKFEVNSQSIYVYISSKQSDSFHFEVFKYVSTEINYIISTILKLLNK